jgi:N-dimethylarginine dimethylaminohydrolase
MNVFKQILLVSPEHFEIKYAINSHMQSGGKLNQIDKALAVSQWQTLKQVYEKLGFKTSVLAGDKDLPDMVFCANQSFVFWDLEHQNPAVLMSHMRSDFRKPEVKHFRNWYQRQGYIVYELEDDVCFEGNGDGLLHLSKNLILGGYGERTDKKVYEQIEDRFGYEVLTLELSNPYFYHLDTCLCVLNSDTVAIVYEAFTERDRNQLFKLFKNVIKIEEEEGAKTFAGNAFSPNQKDVILQKGSFKFMADLQKNGFHPIEVDTSEYIKAGGSVFCLKMFLF